STSQGKEVAMKFVVTGAAGHVSKPLTELLLKKGHDVTVVGRSPKDLEGLVKCGANTAIGDMADAAFLTEAFKGADGATSCLRLCGIPMIRKSRASGPRPEPEVPTLVRPR